MSAHSYASLYPKDVKIDEGIKRFFEEFYKLADTEEAHELYTSQYTKDAVLIMASKKCKGESEILSLRKSMWVKVAARRHTPIQIFPFGSRTEDLMLYGTVDYVFRDGGTALVDWAGRAELVKEDEKWKLKYYQVYLDTASQQTNEK